MGSGVLEVESPTHLTTSLKVRRPSLSSHSVSSLWSWLWTWILDVRKVFVDVYIREEFVQMSPLLSSWLCQHFLSWDLVRLFCISQGVPALFLLVTEQQLHKLSLACPHMWMLLQFCSSFLDLLRFFVNTNQNAVGSACWVIKLEYPCGSRAPPMAALFVKIRETLMK